MNAINTAAKYDAIVKTCSYYNHVPLILADHCGFIKTCVMNEDECPNGAINEDDVQDLYRTKSWCMESIKRHSFARQIGTILATTSAKREQNDLIYEAVRAEANTKPNQCHQNQNTDKPSPPIKSQIKQASKYSPTKLPIIKSQAINSTPEDSIFFHQQYLESAASQRVQAAESYTVTKEEGDLYYNIFAIDSLGEKVTSPTTLPTYLPTKVSTFNITNWNNIELAENIPPKNNPPKQPPPDRDKMGSTSDFRGCLGDFRGCFGDFRGCTGDLRGCQRVNNASREGVLDIRYLCGVPRNYGPTSNGVPCAGSAVGPTSAIARELFGARSIATT